MEVVYNKVYDLSVHNGMVDWDKLKEDGVAVSYTHLGGHSWERNRCIPGNHTGLSAAHSEK